MGDLTNTATEPLGILWAGIVMLTLWRIRRAQWNRLFWPTITAILLALLGSLPISSRILATLERPYAGVDIEKLEPADAIVMLGGVLRFSENDAARVNFESPADRVMMAADLARRGKGRALVLGGGGPRKGDQRPIEGELVKRWLSTWGMTNVPIALLGHCTNTRDEAARTLALAQKFQWKRIILVTSASHMRRSEAIFRKLGMQPVCVACDFDALSEIAHPRPVSPFPRWQAIQQLSAYCHEIIGYWVYALRGWV